MNCEKILFDLALCYGGNFANVNDFCSAVVKLHDLKTYNDIVSLFNSNRTKELQKITKDNVLSMLISDDVMRYSIDSYEYMDQNRLEECVVEHINKVIDFYRSIGLDIAASEIQVFFCDSFPKPFNNNKGLALAPDSYDEMKFGIKKGIYFLKSNISSYQSRLLVAHEILHHVCAKNNPELLARGLEEGLCELIGSYITNFTLFDKPITENYLRFRRFKYNNPNQKFRLYTDYLRMAYLLLKRVGIAGIVNILNAGRGKIKLTETALLHNENLDELVNAMPIMPKDITYGLDNLLLGTIQNEVLSPLAYYVVKNYNGEKSVSSFSKIHDIDLNSCFEAFNEIQNRIYGCVIDGDVIEFSDLIQLKKNGNVLYECR